MTIRAVVFDIGGVLEITPDLDVSRQWETRLGLPAGGLEDRMHDAWVGGSIGTVTEEDVHRAIRDRLGLDERIYALVCTRLGVSPAETAFLDDIELCVTGARHAGIHAIHYRDNAQAIAELEELLSRP
ncbi:MAG: hypothetical protein ACRDPY_03375 [Streptosporangiaceae bacterium]